jgi:hypothetical protein
LPSLRRTRHARSRTPQSNADGPLEHVCSYNVGLQAPPEVIGPVAEGLRLNIYLTGGEVSGPKLRGKVRPVGGDWGTMRTDGVFVLDARTTIETNDGALIGVTYSGLIDGGPDGYQNMLNRQLSPDGTPFRITPRFQTAHPTYQWANRLVCVGIGELHFSVPEVRYDIYAVR